MSLVLSPEELVALTGYKYPSRQAAWLRKNGIKYRLNRFNRPVVDRTHYLAKMGLGAAKEPEPNWTAKQGASNERQPARTRSTGPVHAPRQAPRLVLLHPYTEAEFLNLPTCEMAIAGINAVAAEARALRDENKGLMQRLAKLRKTENPH